MKTLNQYFKIVFYAIILSFSTITSTNAQASQQINELSSKYFYILGGDRNGIRLNSSSDYSIYTAWSGKYKAINGGNSRKSGRVDFAMRFRMYKSPSVGFIFENTHHEVLASISAQDGLARFKALNVSGKSFFNQLQAANGSIDFKIGRNRDPSILLHDGTHRWKRIGSDGSLAFWANGKAEKDNSPQLFLNKNGNLGIGKFPQKKLDVAGDVKISGAISLANNTINSDGSYEYNFKSTSTQHGKNYGNIGYRFGKALKHASNDLTKFTLELQHSNKRWKSAFEILSTTSGADAYFKGDIHFSGDLYKDGKLYTPNDGKSNTLNDVNGDFYIRGRDEFGLRLVRKDGGSLKLMYKVSNPGGHHLIGFTDTHGNYLAYSDNNTKNFHVAGNTFTNRLYLDNNGGNSKNNLRIDGHANNLILIAGGGTGAAATNIGFKTAEADSPSSLKAVITSEGRMGIGIEKPTKMLDVNGDIHAAGNTFTNRLYLENTKGNSKNHLRINGHANNLYLIAGGGTGAAATNIAFATAAADTLSSQKAIITSEGRMGIGIAKPTKMLDVAGDINLNGTLSFASDDVKVGTNAGKDVVAEGAHVFIGKGAGSKASFDKIKVIDYEDDANTNPVTGDEYLTKHSVFVVNNHEDLEKPLLFGNFAKPNESSSMAQLAINTHHIVDSTALTVSGSVHIGPKNMDPTAFPSKKGYEDALLWVEKGIVTENVIYAFASDWDDWPDYVFEEDYDLMKLDELEEYINKNKHLPGIAPVDQIKEEGLKSRETIANLLLKIEELTLYTIDQEKKIDSQNKLNQTLLDRLEAIENQLNN